LTRVEAHAISSEVSHRAELAKHDIQKAVLTYHKLTAFSTSATDRKELMQFLNSQTESVNELVAEQVSQLKEQFTQDISAVRPVK
jgi:hypothetical protein